MSFTDPPSTLNPDHLGEIILGVVLWTDLTFDFTIKAQVLDADGNLCYEIDGDYTDALTAGVLNAGDDTAVETLVGQIRTRIENLLSL